MDQFVLPLRTQADIFRAELHQRIDTMPDDALLSLAEGPEADAAEPDPPSLLALLQPSPPDLPTPTHPTQLRLLRPA